MQRMTHKPRRLKTACKRKISNKITSANNRHPTGVNVNMDVCQPINAEAETEFKPTVHDFHLTTQSHANQCKWESAVVRDKTMGGENKYNWTRRT
jgi:hypothetical protein